MITFYPAKQFVTPADKLNRALRTIRDELDQRIIELESQSKLLEAQRLKMRTEYDLEMLQEMGFCNGIENYSRHLCGPAAGIKAVTRCWIFSRRITCWWWTSRTPRFRRSAECMRATARARPCWSITASVCRARSIIGR